MRVRLDRLSFAYGEGSANARHIFADVDADFADGGFFAVTGPSGSGKTTLFRLLSRRLEPTSGAVLLDDRPLTDISASVVRRRIVAQIFQEYLLVPYLDAVDNILLAREIAGDSSVSADRAAELLDLVGLARIGRSEVRHLSGGEQQRVAIARALSGDPALLLADEPTGALDAENTARVATLLKRLAHEHGVTIISGTHDPDFASFADAILTIRDLRIVRDPVP